MKTLTVRRYQSQDNLQWNAFCKAAKNATFLFEKDFMDYHSDRFEDFSLLIFEAETLVGILPAHKVGDTIYSHKGLTYGGLVFSKTIKLPKAIRVFEAILMFLNTENIQQLELKLLPKFYHTFPADEMDYMLFLTEAKLISREAASIIDMKHKLKIQSNRKEGVKKAKEHELVINEGDIGGFWTSVLEPTLKQQFNTRPVHSRKEIEALAEDFPQHIKQFNVYQESTIVAGATIFETETTAHTQYIASDEQRQQLGSLDFLFDYLLNTVYSDKRYFSFGTSNSDAGKRLNIGLNYWKECFGARTSVHETYLINTENHKLLNHAVS